MISKAPDAVMSTFPAPGRAIRDRCVVHYPDVINGVDDTTPALRRVALIVGYNSVAFAPMGLAGPWHRHRRCGSFTSAFTDKELAILQAFADRAVIAIQNARLFEEVQVSNRALADANKQLTETLEQQTATTELLKVIGRSTFDSQRLDPPGAPHRSTRGRSGHRVFGPCAARERHARPRRFFRAQLGSARQKLLVHGCVVDGHGA